jgi:acyl carrier protein
MNQDELRSHVLEALAAVAPEADVKKLRPNVSLREQLDIDSMDFLNFVIAIHAALKVDIPERDYPKLATIDGCIEYLSRLLSRQSEGSGDSK